MRARARLKLVGLGAAFCGLTALGLWWAARSSGLGLEQLKAFGALQADDSPTLVLALCLSAGVIAADILRFWLAARMVKAPIGWRAATDASIANAFFAWITPGSAMAEPATIYALTRHNISVDAAATLTFTKTITSVSMLLSCAFLIMVSGHGPSLPWYLYAPFASGTGVFVALLLGLGLATAKRHTAKAKLSALERFAHARWASTHPKLAQLAQKLNQHTSATIDRLARFREYGGWGLLNLTLGHLIYYVCFVGVPVVLSYGFGAPHRPKLWALTIIYQTFIYVAPTPGGAGLSEASAAAFFGDVLPAAQAALMVALFRAMTFYAQILVGLLYLPAIGALSGVLDSAKPAASRRG